MVYGVPALSTKMASTETQPDGDVDLVLAAQQNRAAFAPLYARYVRPIYRYCYRRLQSHEAAEDATSQTFLKALAGLQRFSSQRGTFRAWLFTIADRVVIDIHRRGRPQFDIEMAGELPVDELSPEESVIANETAGSVQQALARLTPDQRRVVALRLSGLTGPEIAHVIGRDHQAVKSLQFRAYGRLRQLLTGDETR